MVLMVQRFDRQAVYIIKYKQKQQKLPTLIENTFRKTHPSMVMTMLNIVYLMLYDLLEQRIMKLQRLCQNVMGLYVVLAPRSWWEVLFNYS